ncbi:uncharacterized protein LOC110717795 [Chenopodium quinoa]|uniref:uncharacterized protein LOC110717795 n=1 Tax=Chenopodium quinoa TaxID=63459 RepID=UPI000B77A0D2|nr:uncharacterized protein LOC110717795 [Chenopodium quinoa]
MDASGESNPKDVLNNDPALNNWVDVTITASVIASESEHQIGAPNVPGPEHNKVTEDAHSADPNPESETNVSGGQGHRRVLSWIIVLRPKTRQKRVWYSTNYRLDQRDHRRNQMHLHLQQKGMVERVRLMPPMRVKMQFWERNQGHLQLHY